jgi:23S rRNA (uridine2552-2'-O)-methyltransferase
VAPRGGKYEPHDAFYEKAQAAGYRSRAVYKLEDLLREAPAVRRGSTVLELGCWPGGWLQVLAKRVGPEGLVVGCDTKPTEPLDPPVTVLRLDFTEFGAIETLAEAVGGRVHALFSDAAPTMSGIKDVDRGAAEEIHASTLAIAQAVLEPGAFLIAKGFPGPPADAFRKELRAAFAQVSEKRPEGKRAASKEFYWVARGFGEKKPPRG